VIEFVMSRVWMVVAGLAVAAVIMAAFGGLNDGIAEHRSMAGAGSIADLIEELEAEAGAAEMRVTMDGMIADGETIVIHPGSIWVQGDGRSRAVACSSNIILFDNGRTVDELRLASGDVIVVRASSGTVQLEKVSTM